MYTYEQLLDDVRKEAEALKVHATKEELGRLNIEDLDPASTIRCYYGLMTGECDSPRASELIQKCTAIYLDGPPRELDTVGITSEFHEYRWSPIEYYIGLPDAKNANLIAYLKGETETLVL